MRGEIDGIVREVAVRGAGEIMVYSIDRDGTYMGYDHKLLSRIASLVTIPVVACGGGRDIDDLKIAVTSTGCSAAAAGSLFVFKAQNQGVLINYPPSAIR